MKMKRRGFLKAIGATLAGGLGMGATKSVAKPRKQKWATGGVVDVRRDVGPLAPGEAISANGSDYSYHVQIHVSSVESFIASLNRSKPEIIRNLNHA